MGRRGRSQRARCCLLLVVIAFAVCGAWGQEAQESAVFLEDEANLLFATRAEDRDGNQQHFLRGGRPGSPGRKRFGHGAQSSYTTTTSTVYGETVDSSPHSDADASPASPPAYETVPSSSQGYYSPSSLLPRSSSSDDAFEPSAASSPSPSRCEEYPDGFSTSAPSPPPSPPSEGSSSEGSLETEASPPQPYGDYGDYNEDPSYSPGSPSRLRDDDDEEEESYTHSEPPPYGEYEDGDHDDSDSNSGSDFVDSSSSSSGSHDFSSSGYDYSHFAPTILPS